MTSNYPIIVVGIEKYLSKKKERKMKNLKRKRIAASVSTNLMVSDACHLIDCDNIVDAYNHPEFKEVCAIVGECLNYKPNTVKLRFQVIVDLINGKYYEKIAQPTGAYLKGWVETAYITDAQIAACEEVIAAA